MLGTEPADLPADDLVTEYTSGPFSAILKEDGATGGGDTPILAGEDTAAGPAAAGPAAAGPAAAAAAAAAAGAAAAHAGRGRKRWSLALGLAVLIAAGVTSELALLQHAAHQARVPVSPSRGPAPASAAPTAPASAPPTARGATAHPSRASAAPSVSPAQAPAVVPAQQAAAAPADQRARLGDGDDRYRGWPPAWPPGFRGWPILPFGRGDGLRPADHPGVLPGFGLPQPQRGFPQHW